MAPSSLVDKYCPVTAYLSNYTSSHPRGQQRQCQDPESVKPNPYHQTLWIISVCFRPYFGLPSDRLQDNLQHISLHSWSRRLQYHLALRTRYLHSPCAHVFPYHSRNKEPFFYLSYMYYSSLTGHADCFLK